MQKGFLLSYIKYGDNDAILHCFTRDYGYTSYFVKGLYAPKNKKKAYLQPLNELAIATLDKGSRSPMKTVSKLELNASYDASPSVKKNTIIFFVSDFLNQILKNENSNPLIYQEIEGLKAELEAHNHQSHLVFLFRILCCQGLNPLYDQCPYLNPESGNFEAEKSHPLFDENISKLWKLLIVSDNNYAIPIAASLRKSFLDSLLVYYHYHFTDFRTPHSLEILQSIFE
ncbi:DNA repair protein RecO (recombination protein O) [Bergeyella porcorum]|uniref:DNA repair protein RecO (Recombination protein O) n=1 Tax=Bergeyella porcorum TaxID=1735111 RepID=A0AAU0F194_9FLAO